MAGDNRPRARTLGFVAAGGRSTRMGRDKALLPWGGATLLDHAVARLREACGEARILCGAEARYAGHGAPLVLDRVAERGPLAGLEAALAAAGGWDVLLLAVDLPLVPAALLRWLPAQGTDADVVAPYTARGPEPLCAVYRAGCAAPVARALERDGRMTAFWDEVRVHAVPADELRGFGEPERLFRNVNDRADYEEARPR